jgi:hypothetical protein
MKKIYIRPAIQIVGISLTSALLLPISGGGSTDESLVSRQIDEEIWNSEDYWDSPFER